MICMARQGDTYVGKFQSPNFAAKMSGLNPGAVSHRKKG
jgi:hypothetical protein